MDQIELDDAITNINEVINITTSYSFCPNCDEVLEIFKIIHPTVYSNDGAHVSNYQVKRCRHCNISISISAINEKTKYPTELIFSEKYFENSSYIIISKELLFDSEKFLISLQGGFNKFIKGYNKTHKETNAARMKFYTANQLEKYYKENLDHRRIGESWLKYRLISWFKIFDIPFKYFNFANIAMEKNFDLIVEKISSIKKFLLSKFPCLNNTICKGRCGETIIIDGSKFIFPKNAKSSNPQFIFILANCGRVLACQEILNPFLFSEYFDIFVEYLKYCSIYPLYVLFSFPRKKRDKIPKKYLTLPPLIPHTSSNNINNNNNNNNVDNKNNILNNNNMNNTKNINNNGIINQVEQIMSDNIINNDEDEDEMIIEDQGTVNYNQFNEFTFTIDTLSIHTQLSQYYVRWKELGPPEEFSSEDIEKFDFYFLQSEQTPCVVQNFKSSVIMMDKANTHMVQLELELVHKTLTWIKSLNGCLSHYKSNRYLVFFYTVLFLYHGLKFENFTLSENYDRGYYFGLMWGEDPNLASEFDNISMFFSDYPD